MNKYLVLGIIAVVLVSGCASQGTGTGAPAATTNGFGLEFLGFESDSYEVFAGKTIHPFITVENQGQETVTGTEGLVLLIAPSDWEILSGPDGKEWFTEFKKTDLEPENPATGAPADQKTYRWTIKAPGIDDPATTEIETIIDVGQQRVDPIIAKLYYDYTTKALGTVFVYPESERLEDDKSTSSETFTTTRAPVAVDVSVLPDPPVVAKGETFTLQILLTNIGEGTPYEYQTVHSGTGANYKIEEDQRNVVNVTLIGIGDQPAVGTTSSDALYLLDGSCLDDIQLVNDKATVLCDVLVNEDLLTKKPYAVSVLADYGYTTEEEISVTISGK